MPHKILIAEDEPHIRRTLHFILEREGYEVLAAADVEEALDLARRERPDLILMDLMMPRRDGLEVLRELRSSEKFKSIPVILLTALSDSHDKARGLDTGADDYLTKPFDPREVIARVRARLRIQSLQAGEINTERARVALETAGAAAHEMSQPLTVMYGNVELLLMKMPQDDPLRPLVEKIRQNGDRAIALLRKLQSVQRYATKSYTDRSAILDLERSSTATPDPEGGTGDPESGTGDPG